ncbi:MAG: DUF3606 domain-containing protein [Burkholderiales bacterium]|jgi:hypothetical protein
MSNRREHQNEPADAHGEKSERSDLDPDRVRYWAKVFGVTEAQLREALNTLGLQWDDLRSEVMSAKLNKLLFARPRDTDTTAGGRDT